MLRALAARRFDVSPPHAAVAAVVAVVALALAGLAIAAVVLAGDGSSSRAHGQWTVGQDIPTSFGAVAIDGVGRAATRPSDAVAFVALTNLTRRPVAYSPGQFRLLAGEDRTPIGGMRVRFRGGTIQPSASFSGQVQFRAPRDGSKRFIEYREPGRSPVVIDLSRVGPMTPDSAFEGFAGR